GLQGRRDHAVLCIGACLGSTFAVSAGLDGASTAALGMVALFAACSNCPLCSLVLGAELFGVSALPACALVALVAFACSYRCSLYQSAVIAWTPAGMRALLRRPSAVQR
ncbi:chloride channel protein, partial [Eggerthella sinensis]|uniref:chloride channel protein n=1 Tax=Eggerthella sinensis TaxID=242230 RepID=UPI002FD85462